MPNVCRCYRLSGGWRAARRAKKDGTWARTVAGGKAMGIRIAHQPSGAAVGIAAYSLGLGQRKERQQKYAMMQWETEHRRLAWESKYSGAGSRQRRLGSNQEAVGTWVDPLADAIAAAKGAKGKGGTGAEVIRIRAQQRANERRARLNARKVAQGQMPKPLKYSGVDPSPTDRKSTR